MKSKTKSTARKVAKKKAVIADTFPNVVVVHEGDPDSPLFKFPTLALNPSRSTDIVLLGLRQKYSVKVRKFTSNGIEIK